MPVLHSQHGNVTCAQLLVTVLSTIAGTDAHTQEPVALRQIT